MFKNLSYKDEASKALTKETYFIHKADNSILSSSQFSL
jgi:hypothetical protein